MQPDNRIYFDPPVTEAKAFAAKKGQKAKDALGKVASLVPGEILGAYGAALGALPTFNADWQPRIGLTCYVLGILGTWSRLICFWSILTPK